MVGESVIRPDAYEKVLGTASFPDDLEFQNMLYAGVKRSSIAYGRVKSINISEVKKLDGVIDVIDYKGIPGEINHGVVFKDIPILVKDTIKRIGDCIVLIIAKDKTSLKIALEKVNIEYEEYKGIFTIEDALKSDAPILGNGNNILYDITIKKGEANML